MNFKAVSFLNCSSADVDPNPDHFAQLSRLQCLHHGPLQEDRAAPPNLAHCFRRVRISFWAAWRLPVSTSHESTAAACRNTKLCHHGLLVTFEHKIIEQSHIQHRHSVHATSESLH
jgi:hypothetical protein